MDRKAADTHDRPSQFGKSLAFWHEMFSNASPEPIELLVGETLAVQKAVGSEFEVKADSGSASIQVIDIVLWL